MGGEAPSQQWCHLESSPGISRPRWLPSPTPSSLLTPTVEGVRGWASRSRKRDEMGHEGAGWALPGRGRRASFYPLSGQKLYVASSKSLPSWDLRLPICKRANIHIHDCVTTDLTSTALAGVSRARTSWGVGRGGLPTRVGQGGNRCSSCLHHHSQRAGALLGSHPSPTPLPLWDLEPGAPSFFLDTLNADTALGMVPGPQWMPTVTGTNACPRGPAVVSFGTK